ncbi:transglycosylase SLT domain-containing protein, partial [Bacillus thuringiensis]|nr:transglycosylase SLT domain-containing protein [Bacillus thuringiensis]
AGDQYSHGSRNAIDVAFPASMNGSSKYREAGNYAFEKFKNQVGYVIALNKVRDRAGTSGTGIHDAWANWASGGHMDHLHINGVKDPQSGGSGEDFGGSGVGRWRSTAIKALRMTGQYSTANLNALLNQMRTESNGNPRAINNWDSNAAKGTPSKGLMQVIDPTFQSYALKGYNKNIYDPLSNILASIRYTLSRYGSLTAGWRGVGYENGGLITREHLAMVGEGNKPEVVIPLDSAKRTRAMQLLALAQKKMGVSQNTIVAGGGTSDELLIQLLQAQQQTNMLLQALLEKDTDVYIDKRKVTAEIEPEIAKTKERKTMGSSRRRGVVS